MQTEKLNAGFLYLVKWLVISLLVSCLVGTATAWFLIALDFITLWRSGHIWIVNFLPLIGLAIGLGF